VLIQASARRGPESIFEQGVDVDGKIEALFLLGVGGGPLAVPEHGGFDGAGALHGPGEHGPVGIAAGGHHRVDAVRPGDHRHIEVASPDVQGGAIDQVLGVVAPGGAESELEWVHARLFGHQLARVDVLPAQGVENPEGLHPFE
jgi:hypothetical protein